MARVKIKITKAFFYLGVSLSLISGLWRFFAIPYIYGEVFKNYWKLYERDIPGYLRLEIEYLNFFFALIICGLSILIIIHRNKIFQGNADVLSIYGFLIFIWLSRVAGDFVAQQPSDHVLKYHSFYLGKWAYYALQIAPLVIFVCLLVPLLIIIVKSNDTKKPKMNNNIYPS